MKQTYKDKQTRLDEHTPESVPKFEQIQSRLSHLADVNPLNIDVTLTFSISFVEAFLNDTPNYEISEGVLARPEAIGLIIPLWLWLKSASP